MRRRDRRQGCTCERPDSELSVSLTQQGTYVSQSVVTTIPQQGQELGLQRYSDSLFMAPQAQAFPNSQAVGAVHRNPVCTPTSGKSTQPAFHTLPHPEMCDPNVQSMLVRDGSQPNQTDLSRSIVKCYS